LDAAHGQDISVSILRECSNALYEEQCLLENCMFSMQRTKTAVSRHCLLEDIRAVTLNAASDRVEGCCPAPVWQPSRCASVRDRVQPQSHASFSERRGTRPELRCDAAGVAVCDRRAVYSDDGMTIVLAAVMNASRAALASATVNFRSRPQALTGGDLGPVTRVSRWHDSVHSGG